MKRVLIVGGTGMLAEASREIARDFGEVVLLARRPEGLAGEIEATGIAVDWRDRVKVGEVLVGLGVFDLVVSWVHDDGLWCVPGLEGLLKAGGRSIRVHGSAAGDPANGIERDAAPRAGIVRQNVVLGWVMENGRKRWLTNAEICGGVMEAYGSPARLGVVVGVLG